MRSALAGGAVPRAAAACADLLDRGSATLARLAFAAVDPEFLLHPPPGSVRRAGGAVRGSLPRDPSGQGRPDRTMERRDLGCAQLTCGAQRMETGPPEGLVGVDVPDASEAPLVQKRRLEGRAAAFGGFRGPLRR